LNDRVEACQLLGSAGRSGNAGSAHLHMEARVGSAGKRFESMAYYSADVTQAEQDAYLLWRISGEFRHFDPMLLFTASEP